MRSGSCASFGLFGSKSGSDTSATISPVFTLETRPGSRLGLVLVLGCNSSRSACSNPQIDRQFHRLLQPVGGSPRGADRPDRYCQPFLHPGDAWLSMFETDQVRDFGAGPGRHACSRAGSRCREYRGDECPAAASA